LQAPVPDLEENEGDIALQRFVQKYKLQKISKEIVDEFTIDFLLSQTGSQIDAIAMELTPRVIQQNKFKFGVKQLQKEHRRRHKEQKQKKMAKDPTLRLPTPDGIRPYFTTTREVAIDKTMERVKTKYGNWKMVVVWKYYGSDHKDHQIMLKHNLKMDKHRKSKRVLIVDGQDRYSRKSNDTSFIVTKCADELRVLISYGNGNSFYELFINDIAFSDLQTGRAMSFSL